MYTYSAASLLRNRRVGGPSGDRSAQQKRAREARETQRQFEVSSRQFQCVRVVGKGAYGVVCEAIDKTVRDRTQQRVAIKKIKEALFHPLDAKLVLRELKLSRLLSKHPNILGIRTVVKPMSRRKMDTIYVVSSFMDTDLYRLCQSRVELTDKHIRHLMFQTLSGLQFLHSANVLHRDMKTANLLVDRHFNLKICDFGLARLVRPGESLNGDLDQKQENLNGPPLTELVVTLWYRAPELVANSNYDAAIDVWAVGCIFAEMLLRRPVFPGKDHLHQLQLITDVMGTPTEEDVRSIRGAYARRVLRSLPYRPAKPMDRVFGGAHPQAIDLIESLLVFDSTKRATASEALSHPYFDPVRSSTTDIIMENSIEHEFEFDLDVDPQLVPMRQKIYDEIMLYHTKKSNNDDSSSNNNGRRPRQNSRTRARSASRSPNVEALARSSSTTSTTSMESAASSIDSKSCDTNDKTTTKVGSRGRSRSSGRGTTSSGKNRSRSRSSSRTRENTREKDHEKTREKTREKPSVTATVNSTNELLSLSCATTDSAMKSEPPTTTISSKKPTAFQHVVAKKMMTAGTIKPRPIITASASATSLSSIAMTMAASTVIAASTISATTSTIIKTPPPHMMKAVLKSPKTASPPRPPSAGEPSSRPPSANANGGAIPMSGLVPPPPTMMLKPPTSSDFINNKMPSPKRRRAPPPRNRTTSGALVLNSEIPTTTHKKSMDKVTTATSATSMKKGDDLSDKLLGAVEKAQRDSSDLLEDLRMRREVKSVKARVTAASAALDAALATSKIKNSETDRSDISSTTVSNIAPQDRLFERANNRKTVTGRTSAASHISSTKGGLARTVSSPAKINSDYFVSKDNKQKNQTNNMKDEEPRLNRTTSNITSKDNMSINNSTTSSSRASAVVGTTSSRFVKSNSSTSTRLFDRSDRYAKTNSSTSTGTSLSKARTNRTRPSTVAIVGGTGRTSKENVANRNDETSTAPLRRVKKKVTVPRPFTFTSRRKTRATPKHIRNQRDALARRRAREQGKGTRQTRFF